MRRPDQHVIDTLGIAQMRTCFEPLTWTVIKIAHDYGADYEIEVFQDGQTTGIAFKLQLKSSRSSKYSSEGDFLSEEINTANAHYMCLEMRSPILLVHADVERRRTFWSAVQLDTAALQTLASRVDQNTLTFRIPTKNELPATWRQLLDAVAQTETLLCLRALSAQPVSDFLTSIDGRVDKDAVSQDLKNRSDAIRLDRAGELLRSGSFEAAREKLATVIKDENASVENRFWAWLTAEGVETQAAQARGTLQSDQVKIQLSVAARLRRLTRKGPAHLKFFALIATKAAELYFLTHRDFGLHLNAQANQKDGDPFWKAQLAFSQGSSARQIARKYNQCARLAAYAVNYPFRWALPQALLRIIYALIPFLMRLRNDGWKDVEKAYRDRAFQIVKLATWLAADAADENSISMALATASLLSERPDDEVMAWVQQVIPTISDDERRMGLIDLLQEMRQRHDRAPDAEDVVEEERQIYEHMAASLGIELSDQAR